MVMHARKLPRISDGFPEKHQPHSHGYENSKYTNKYRYGNHDKSRDSPSTNSLRSSSPDSHSQSPRYHKSNYYKVREKERERERENRDRDRDRDREYKDYRERDNSPLPKDRRRDIREHGREKDIRDSRSGMHDNRINSIHKKDEKERLMRVGDWSEHVSSSGKKYYYNCRSEVSQWEKPPEWIEWERNHRPSSIALKDSNIHRVQDKMSRPDKHSSIADSYRDHRDSRDNNDHSRDRRDYRNEEHFDRRDVRKYPQDIGTTDMEISSGDSTPTSESMHHARNENSGHDSTLLTSYSHSGGPNQMKNSKTMTSSLPGIVPISVASTSSEYHPGNNVVTSAQGCPQLLNTHPRLAALTNQQDKCDDLSKSSKLPLEPLNISSNSNNCSGGPPTPTHSENHDGIDLRKISSPTGLNSLHSLAQNTSNIPTLTPSLANYYKESLISHVQGWPADVIEKQCQRSCEEAHTMSSMFMTKVSAELKMARSLVRLAEIQSMLHEQRILFLRDQKRELEEVKAQNCFMNDT